MSKAENALPAHHEARPPSLREAMDRFGFGAKKSLGQHFLLDPSIVARIAHLGGDLRGVTVIEVGPGPGGLTRALLDTDAPEVFAVEIDARALPILEDLATHYPGRLTVISADALRYDLKTLGKAPRQIIANLPYNVGTKLLLNWLAQASEWQRMTLMFQLEVAQRICATVGSPAYGRLSVIAQWCATCQVVMRVPAGAFTPPPKVDSAVVDIKPHANQPPSELFGAMERVTSAAFGQRRKMLRSALKGIRGDLLLERAGIDPARRAETLHVDEFALLATILAELNLDGD